MPHTVVFDLEQYPLFMAMPEPAETFQRWVMTMYSAFKSQHQPQSSFQVEGMLDTVRGTCETLRAAAEAENERSRKEMRALETRLVDMAISTRDLVGNELRSVGSTNTTAVRELETRLSGLFSKSQSLGVVGEKSLAAVLAEDVPSKDWEVRATGSESHSGDYMVSYKGDFVCMLDAKNYTKNVSKLEVEKLKSDMERHNVRTGAVVSLKSRVAGRGVDDMEVYTDSSGVRRCIAYLGNSGEHPRKVWLGIQWLRCVWSQFLCSKGDVCRSAQIDDRTARAFSDAMEAAKELHEAEHDLEAIRTMLKKAVEGVQFAESRASDRAYRIQKKVADCFATLGGGGSPAPEAPCT